MVTAQQSYKISFYPTTVSIEAARGAGGERVVIDRTTGAVRTVAGAGAGAGAAAAAFAGAPQRTVTAHGVMGLISLQRGPYLVLITGREAAGTIGASTVYRVTETRVVKAAAESRVVAGFDAVDEATYLRLLESALAVESFYFSYDMDMTSSLQRQRQQRDEKGAGSALFARANDEFFYNKFLSEALVAAGAGAFVLPVMHGFFECRPAVVNGTAFNYVLVTRRGRKRQGARFFVRGADAEGNVANFAETEQIVDFAAGSASADARVAGVQMAYVQVRGSIPLEWAQVINMRYAPALRVEPPAASAKRFAAHMGRLIADYDEVAAVNLVNKAGSERRVADAFAQLSRDLGDPRYHYTHFDFHRECSRMRWHRLSILADELAPLTERFGYFRARAGAGVQQRQRGVVRTNCMDCLDRTNVVQSELARAVLEQQLRAVGVLGPAEPLAALPALRAMLNAVWADNADAVSCAYSGTGALKTDFTRTGRRTHWGALQDARNSLERYVRGNFFDGERQDAADLLLGAHRVQPGQSPFAHRLSAEARALVGTAYVCLFMLTYAVLYPRAGRWFAAANVAFVACWSAVLALVFAVVMRSHTAELLSWPRLVAYPYRPPVTRTSASLELPLVGPWLASREGPAGVAPPPSRSVGKKLA
ncbi:Phosphoinositide phosphatase sac1 [Coemansia javaensis]|uniref:Phosphoinositide phosphatase sac1 n=1 Tax=Coemansia javaensis TaxID=2761396 RepID=A0A9W8LLC0_9FUNG|nr:Phosphoinositide phosphatase sac1 [Coemansia javaensis]